MEELKKKLAELEELEIASERAEMEYESDPENEEKERAFDRACDAEWNAFMSMALLIVGMSGGKVDEKEARAILRVKRNDLLNIVS